MPWPWNAPVTFLTCVGTLVTHFYIWNYRLKPEAFALHIDAIRLGETWRFAASLFVHTNWTHAIISVLAMWTVGGDMEAARGSLTFLCDCAFMWLCSYLGTIALVEITVKRMGAWVLRSRYTLGLGTLVVGFIIATQFGSVPDAGVEWDPISVEEVGGDAKAAIQERPRASSAEGGLRFALYLLLIGYILVVPFLGGALAMLTQVCSTCAGIALGSGYAAGTPRYLSGFAGLMVFCVLYIGYLRTVAIRASAPPHHPAPVPRVHIPLGGSSAASWWSVLRTWIRWRRSGSSSRRRDEEGGLEDVEGGDEEDALLLRQRRPEGTGAGYTETGSALNGEEAGATSQDQEGGISFGGARVSSGGVRISSGGGADLDSGGEDEEGGEQRSSDPVDVTQERIFDDPGAAELAWGGRVEDAADDEDQDERVVELGAQIRTVLERYVRGTSRAVWLLVSDPNNTLPGVSSIRSTVANSTTVPVLIEPGEVGRKPERDAWWLFGGGPAGVDELHDPVIQGQEGQDILLRRAIEESRQDALRRAAQNQ